MDEQEEVTYCWFVLEPLIMSNVLKNIAECDSLVAVLQVFQGLYRAGIFLGPIWGYDSLGEASLRLYTVNAADYGACFRIMVGEIPESSTRLGT